MAAPPGSRTAALILTRAYVHLRSPHIHGQPRARTGAHGCLGLSAPSFQASVRRLRPHSDRRFVFTGAERDGNIPSNHITSNQINLYYSVVMREHKVPREKPPKQMFLKKRWIHPWRKSSLPVVKRFSHLGCKIIKHTYLEDTFRKSTLDFPKTGGTSVLLLDGGERGDRSRS